MCGVFGYIGQKNYSAQLILEGLKRLEYRGYDSWGVAVVPTVQLKSILVKKRVGKIGNAHVDEMAQGTLAIGHTRWATHGGVTNANAHPHLDCAKKIAVIHNGIVENFQLLKQRLIEKGHTFISETDTEVIVHLIEEKMKTLDFEEAFRQAFLDLEGLNGVVAIHLNQRKILAARNGSPLVLGFGLKENYISSDPAALLSLTKSVYFLKDEQMAIVGEKDVVVKNIHTNKEVIFSTQKLRGELKEAELGEYPHFMLKEIFEQPEVISRIMNHSSDLTAVVKLISNAEDIYFIGCGTATHAAMVGEYLFAEVAHVQTRACLASEFSSQLQFLNDKSVVIALSQSGETMDLLEQVKRAKQKQAQVIAIVNVEGSTLYRIADANIMINAGPEKAVASTKAFLGKLSQLYVLAYQMRNRGQDGGRVLSQATDSIKKVFHEKNIEQIKNLADQLKDVNHLYVIGRGLSHAIALEAALKIKEISYIHAEGFAGGELKHGTLALIEKGTPCLVIMPNDETYAAILSSAMEMKARGGFVIGISAKKEEVFDLHLSIDDLKGASIFPIVVTMQLLAYYLALMKNLDPDKPRNLAKSVTVK